MDFNSSVRQVRHPASPVGYRASTRHPLRPQVTFAFPRSFRALGVLPFAASLALLPSAASSTEWLETVRDLHPYAAVSYTYNSNLLLNPPGLNDQSDRYVTLEAGLDTELNLNRQRLLIDGRVFHNSYDRFSRFDYTGGKGSLIWKWLLGKLWEGDLGYAYNRRLRGFGEEIIATRNLIDTNRVYATANRWLTDRWKVGGLVDWTDVSYSESKARDNIRYGLGANLTYYTEAENSIGLVTAYKEGKYSNVDNQDYVDFSIGPAADWQVTAQTRLAANLFYKSRTYDVLSDRDFEGPVGRLSALWEVTGKTAIKAAVYRDISNLNDDIATYALIDGMSLEPTWAITGKTSLRALASFERRDFQGSEDAAAVVGLEERVDDVTALGLWVDWNVRRNVLFSLGYGVNDRNSNRPLREYNSEYVEARFQVGL